MNKIIIMNGFKMNYDHSLDYTILGDEVIAYDDTDKKEFIERATGNILITKEMPVTKEMIEALPDYVELIVEAGT